MNFFEQHDILTNYVFRKKRSRESQHITKIQDLAAVWTTTQIDAVLLDFWKAFDKVPHERLLTMQAPSLRSTRPHAQLDPLFPLRSESTGRGPFLTNIGSAPR